MGAFKLESSSSLISVVIPNTDSKIGKKREDNMAANSPLSNPQRARAAKGTAWKPVSEE